MKRFILIPLFLISIICSATSYYVKSTGNDASAGTSDGTAWAHHPWMSTWTGTVTLVAGDIVYMNKGDTWTIAGPVAAYMTVGQNGSAGSYITTSAYGTGAKPIINISTNTDFPVIYANGKSYLIFDNLEITHNSATYDAGDQHGFLFSDDTGACHDITITNCTIHNCGNSGINGDDNCYNITIGDITATSTATAVAYSNKIYDCGYIGIQLAGCNSTTFNANFQIYYNYIYDIDETALQVNSYGIATSGTTNSAGWPKYVYVRYNRIENIPGWEAVDCHGGEYYYIQDNYIKNTRLGISLTAADLVDYPDAILNHVWVERNEIVQPGASAIAYTRAMAVTSQLITAKANDVYIRDNEIYWEVREIETQAIGIEIWRAQNTVIDGNKIYSGPSTASQGAIKVDASTGYGCNDIIIRNNWVNEWAIGIELKGDDLTGDIEVYNNILVSDDETQADRGTLCINNAVIDDADITIYDNTIMKACAAADAVIVQLNRVAVNLTAGSTITMKNNIIGFTAVHATGIYVETPGTIGGTLDIDYNIYWDGTAASPFTHGGSARNWAYWTATAGFEDNSPNTDSDLDPLFRNYTGRFSEDHDFDLKNISSAINTGVDLDLTRDYWGFSISGLPDIGAVEYRKRIVVF